MLCIACFPERCPRWAFRRFLLALMCGFIFDSVHVFVAFQNCADVLSSPNCILFHEFSLEVVIQAWAHPHHRDIAGDDVFFIHGCHIMYSGRVAGAICLGHIFCVYVAGIASVCLRCRAALCLKHGGSWSSSRWWLFGAVSLLDLQHVTCQILYPYGGTIKIITPIDRQIRVPQHSDGHPRSANLKYISLCISDSVVLDVHLDVGGFWSASRCAL